MLATMRTPRYWLPSAVLAVIVLVALFMSSTRALMVREFSIRTPDQETVAVLSPSRSLCEGPIISPSQIQAVSIWGGAVTGSAQVALEVKDAGTNRRLAHGYFLASGTGEYVTDLSRTVPGGRPLRICLVDARNSFSVRGSFAADREAIMSSKNHGQQFSLSLLKDSPSLLASLRLAFSRAALWRPSWVGPWTFWGLAIALLATFGLGAIAVASAGSAEDDDDPPADDPDLEGGLPPFPDHRVRGTVHSTAEG